MVGLRLFLRGKHKHVGSVVEVTSVAIAGGDLGRGFVCVCVCAKGRCKDTEFKDANREKVETLKKNFFIRTFPSVCTALASQHRRSDSHPFRTKL